VCVCRGGIYFPARCLLTTACHGDREAFRWHYTFSIAPVLNYAPRPEDTWESILDLGTGWGQLHDPASLPPAQYSEIKIYHLSAKGVGWLGIHVSFSTVPAVFCVMAHICILETGYMRFWECRFCPSTLLCLQWKSPWLAGWVDPRTSLNIVENRKISYSYWESIPISSLKPSLYNNWAIMVPL
jgi:hypothetical protein